MAGISALGEVPPYAVDTSQNRSEPVPPSVGHHGEPPPLATAAQDTVEISLAATGDGTEPTDGTLSAAGGFPRPSEVLAGYAFRPIALSSLSLGGLVPELRPLPALRPLGGLERATASALAAPPSLRPAPQITAARSGRGGLEGAEPAAPAANETPKLLDPPAGTQEDHHRTGTELHPTDAVPHSHGESAGMEGHGPEPHHSGARPQVEAISLAPDAELPDLKPWLLYPRRAEVMTDPDSGRLVLNFASTVANVGEGPLKVSVGGELGDSLRPAFQGVENGDGSQTEVPVGQFYWHEGGGHDHYHLGEFVLYRLREIGPDGEPGEVVGQSGKAGFCLMDSMMYDAALAGSRRTPAFEGQECASGEGQGISVGWADHYPAIRDHRFLEGQTIDVNDLESGEYFLEIVVDPDNLLREADETNNVGRVTVEI